MRVRLEQMHDDETTVVAWFDAEKHWVPLVPLIDSVKAGKTKAAPAISNEVLADMREGCRRGVVYFLQQYETGLKEQVQGLLKSVGGARLPKGDDDAVVMPFHPASFRDFSVYLKHLKKASFGMMRSHPSTLLQGISIVLGRLLRLPFPKIDPYHAYKDKPIYYVGNHMTFICDGEHLPHPPYSDHLDYEMELGVIISWPIKDATPAQARRSIGGFVVVNDFSARDVQTTEIAESNFGFPKSKNFGTSIGNVVVTADEVFPMLERGIEGVVKVNGKLWSQCTSENAMHSVEDMVSFASMGEQLHPGELLATGTFPGGCGVEIGKKLKESDVVEVNINGIGTVKNKIAKKDVDRGQYKHIRYRNGNIGSAKSGFFGGATKTVLFMFLLYLALASSPIDPVAVEWNPHEAPTVSGELAKTIHIAAGELIGPESVLPHKDGKSVLVSNGDGRILRIQIQSGKISTFAVTGAYREECTTKARVGDYSMESECGRPLGLRYSPDGTLYVCDAYLGLMRVADDGKVTPLLSAMPHGSPFRFSNDLDITREGIVYMTDSSTKFYRYQNRLAILEARSNGRLIRYNLNSGESAIVAEGIGFANGVQLTKDESALLVVELQKLRVLRYHLKGPRAGDIEVFSENLPGIPDNIRLAADKESFWVGMYSRPGMLGKIMAYPMLKAFLVKVVPPEILRPPVPRGIICRIGKDGGAPVECLEDASATTWRISEVHEEPAGTLYLGSVMNDYVGMLVRQP